MKACHPTTEAAALSVLTNPNQAQAVAALARNLACQVQSDISTPQLRFIDNVLSYFTGDSVHGLQVDFCSGANRHRLQFGGGYGQTVARACGLKPTLVPRIIDLTAGLGGDALVLASLGAKLLLIERNPIVHALLADGIARALQSAATASCAARMRLLAADSRSIVATREFSAHDVLYIDPMYPERHKRALVKEDMRSVRHLVGTDSDSRELLELALGSNAARVVVKRPKHAAPLIACSDYIASKNTRYDIYSRVKVAHFNED